MKLVNPQNPVMVSWMREQGVRLDAPPFLSGAIEARKLLERLPVKKEPLERLTLGGEEGIFHAGRIKRQWVTDPKYGIPFLSSTDILQADLSHLVRISKRVVRENPKLTIRKDWSLITRSGSIGRMAYVRSDMDGMACSEDVMRVVPNPDRILPGYLYAFLSSKFGVPLVIGGTYGAIIRHIEPHHIAHLPVPRLGEKSEERIHILVQEGARRLTEYGRLLNQATKLLFHLCGLGEPRGFEWHSSTSHLGWIQRRIGTESLRAYNFDPRATQLLHDLGNLTTDPLGELCESRHFKGKIVFKRVGASPEYGVMLVGQRNAFHIHPKGRWLSRKSIEGLGLQVPSGTTLIPSHGTLGERELYCRALMVTHRTSEYAFSGDFFRCVPLVDRITSGYLFAFLRSWVAFRLLRSISNGSKQQYQHPAMMWRFPIPRLGHAEEREVANLVDQGCQNFDAALDAENEAWNFLESAIQEAL